MATVQAPSQPAQLPTSNVQSGGSTTGAFCQVAATSEPLASYTYRRRRLMGMRFRTCSSWGDSICVSSTVEWHGSPSMARNTVTRH